MSNIEHPQHYNQEGKKECIVAMREKFGIRFTIEFCLGNCYKYLYRRGTKPDNSYEQDTAKAEWYLNYAKELLTHHNLLRWYSPIIEKLEIEMKGDNND